MEKLPPTCTIEGCKSDAHFCQHGSETPTLCSAHAKASLNITGVRFEHWDCVEPECEDERALGGDKCAAHTRKTDAKPPAQGIVIALERIDEPSATDASLDPPAAKRRAPDGGEPHTRLTITITGI